MLKEKGPLTQEELYEYLDYLLEMRTEQRIKYEKNEQELQITGNNEMLILIDTGKYPELAYNIGSYEDAYLEAKQRLEIVEMIIEDMNNKVK